MSLCVLESQHHESVFPMQHLCQQPEALTQPSEETLTDVENICFVLAGACVLTGFSGPGSVRRVSHHPTRRS